MACDVAGACLADDGWIEAKGGRAQAERRSAQYIFPGRALRRLFGGDTQKLKACCCDKTHPSTRALCHMLGGAGIPGSLPRRQQRGRALFP